MTAERCVSCGAPLGGRYCSACGELDARERRLTLRAFLAESFRAVTDLDGRTLRSLRTLLGRPGLLVREHMAGRRKPYLNPVQLFLLANVLFFFAVPLTGTSIFSNPLRAHLYQQPHSGLAVQAMRDRNLDLAAPDFVTFEARFDQAVEVHARSLIIVLVPLFALLLFGTRFWRREAALAHLVLALNYVAVLMLVVLAIGLVGQLVLLLPGAEAALRNERPVLVVLLATLGTYLYLALRRAYGDGRLAAAAGAAVLALGTVLLIVVYNAILFFTVFYTL